MTTDICDFRIGSRVRTEDKPEYGFGTVTQLGEEDDLLNASLDDFGDQTTWFPVGTRVGIKDEVLAHYATIDAIDKDTQYRRLIIRDTDGRAVEHRWEHPAMLVLWGTGRTDTDSHLYLPGDVVKVHGPKKPHTLQIVQVWEDTPEPSYIVTNNAVSGRGVRPEWGESEKNMSLVLLPQRAGPLTETVETDPNGTDAHEPGAKLDDGKPKVNLVFGDMARALMAVAEVATAGAEKYTPGGWLHVPDGINRYTAAAGRHALLEGIDGPIDPDSGSLHAAHYAWNTLARLELMLRKMEDNDES